MDVSWVAPDLALGSEPPDLAAVQQAGIDRIVDCRGEVDRTVEAAAAGIAYLRLPWTDQRSVQHRLAADVELALRFIAAGWSGDQKVLVHCAAGRDRSPIVVYAALRILRGLSDDAARRAILLVRPQAAPLRGIASHSYALESLVRDLAGEG